MSRGGDHAWGWGACPALRTCHAWLSERQERNSLGPQRLGEQNCGAGLFAANGGMLCVASHPPRLACSFWWVAVTGMIKLALPAGKANPAPPVGPALGAKVRC